MSDEAMEFLEGKEVNIERLLVGKIGDGKQSKTSTLEKSLFMGLI